MGTNYYVTDRCQHCGREGEELHIGKSSAGWKFCFAAHEHIGLTSRYAWACYLQDDKHKWNIKDEYGYKISVPWLLEWIESTKHKRSHDCKHSNEYIDADGYDFVKGEFS